MLLLAFIALTDVVRVPDLEGLLAPRVQPGDGGARVVMIPIWPAAGEGARETAAPVAVPPDPGTSPAPLVAPSADAGATETGPPTGGSAPVPSTGVPGQGTGGEGGAGRTATPATDRFTRALEALRPRLLDPRLRPGTIDALRTDDERAALRVYARINALNDSILAVMERERRATDWTWTDEDGRRWGISPGKLHLGGVEIPLPLSFSPTPEQRERLREWEEIQAQSVQGEVDATFDDRVEAIREARDAERATP